MKMHRILYLAVGLLAAPLWAEGVLPRFLLVAPEGMDEAAVERVGEWMERILLYEVEVRRVPMWEGERVEEQAEGLGDFPREDVLVTVVLSERLAEDRHAAVLPERRLGVMNVPALYEEGGERELRRLERQAMRIAGFSLGVPPQPLPFCVLSPYETLEELDQIGRGFSPPAMATYRARLVELEVPLSPEAERQLPDVRVNVPSPPAPLVDPLPLQPEE